MVENVSNNSPIKKLSVPELLRKTIGCDTLRKSNTSTSLFVKGIDDYYCCEYRLDGNDESYLCVLIHEIRITSEKLQ